MRRTLTILITVTILMTTIFNRGGFCAPAVYRPKTGRLSPGEWGKGIFVGGLALGGYAVYQMGKDNGIKAAPEVFAVGLVAVVLGGVLAFADPETPVDRFPNNPPKKKAKPVYHLSLSPAMLPNGHLGAEACLGFTW